MWFEGDRLDSIRHECRHEDDIKRWGWTEFSENRYGKESLKDIHNHVKLDLTYLKEGDDWILQVQGNAIRKEKVPRNVSLVFYVSVSGANGTLLLPELTKMQKKVVGSLWEMRIDVDRDTKVQLIFHFIRMIMDMAVFWSLKIHPTHLRSISITPSPLFIWTRNYPKMIQVWATPSGLV